MDYQYTPQTPLSAEGNYYGQAPQPEKKGLAIASLVLGILSITLCCFAGTVFGLIGAILGIVALVKKQKKGMAIGGLITSIIGFIIGIVIVVMVVFSGMAVSSAVSEAEEYLNDEGTREYLKDEIMKAMIEEYENAGLSEAEIEAELRAFCEAGGDEELREILKAFGMESYADVIIEAIEEEYGSESGEASKDVQTSSMRLEATDGTTLFLESDGTFVWYEDADKGTSAPYQSGTYAMYYGSDAKYMLLNDLAEYAITEEELEAYFERNAGDDFYNEDNLCVWITYVEVLDEATGNGNELSETAMVPFYGFYDGNYLDVACMNSANTYTFEVVK